MNRHQMQRQLEKVDDLPTLPTVAMALNQMLQDVATPIEEMVALLEKDQALAIRLLRLVNSSFYGFKSKIASLRHAITLMGYSTVQNAVVTISVIECLKTDSAPKGFDISQFWLHSIRVAVMSRYLASHTNLFVPEEAFTAGLVHDIGKVILVNHFPEVFASLMDLIETEQISFFNAEKRSDSLSHHLIGSQLARRWMLPDALEAAIRNHHSGGGHAGTPLLADMVAVADVLVHVFDKTPGYEFQREAIPSSVREPIVTILKDSSDWFPKVNSEMAVACEFFNKG